jgi:tetratricopeptide (TPR) repeat protein
MLLSKLNEEGSNNAIKQRLLGLAYQETGNYEKALQNYKEYEKYCLLQKEDQGIETLAAKVLLADLYKLKGDHETALKYYKEY